MAIRYMTHVPKPPFRPEDAHKGTFGRVLVIGGSRGMSGAATLAGLGALRGGAGLVYLAVPAGILPIVAAAEPSYLTIPLPEDDRGRMSRDARGELEAIVPRHDAVALGPGWGMSDDLCELAAWLYATGERPMIVDADGLNALAQTSVPLSDHRGPRVLTPHPGEFSRLCGEDVGTIQQNRETMAAEFARQHQIVLVLKGQGTVVTDGEQVFVNPTGNSGMATGGTGDVLTGQIVALLGQKLPAFEAAQLAVYLHGRAGDLAADDLSRAGLISSDLPKYLGRAWREIEG